MLINEEHYSQIHLVRQKQSTSPLKLKRYFKPPSQVAPKPGQRLGPSMSSRLHQTSQAILNTHQQLPVASGSHADWRELADKESIKIRNGHTKPQPKSTALQNNGNLLHIKSRFSQDNKKQNHFSTQQRLVMQGSKGLLLSSEDQVNNQGKPKDLNLNLISLKGQSDQLQIQEIIEKDDRLLKKQTGLQSQSTAALTSNRATIYQNRDSEFDEEDDQTDVEYAVPSNKTPRLVKATELQDYSASVLQPSHSISNYFNRQVEEPQNAQVLHQRQSNGAISQNFVQDNSGLSSFVINSRLPCQMSRSSSQIQALPFGIGMSYISGILNKNSSLVDPSNNRDEKFAQAEVVNPQSEKLRIPNTIKQPSQADQSDYSLHESFIYKEKQSEPSSR